MDVNLNQLVGQRSDDVHTPIEVDEGKVKVVLKHGKPLVVLAPGKYHRVLQLPILGHLNAADFSTARLPVSHTVDEVFTRCSHCLPAVRIEAKIELNCLEKPEILMAYIARQGLAFLGNLKPELEAAFDEMVRISIKNYSHAELFAMQHIRGIFEADQLLIDGLFRLHSITNAIPKWDPSFTKSVKARSSEHDELEVLEVAQRLSQVQQLGQIELEHHKRLLELSGERQRLDLEADLQKQNALVAGEVRKIDAQSDAAVRMIETQAMAEAASELGMTPWAHAHPELLQQLLAASGDNLGKLLENADKLGRSLGRNGDVLRAMAQQIAGVNGLEDIASRKSKQGDGMPSPPQGLGAAPPKELSTPPLRQAAELNGVWVSNKLEGVVVGSGVVRQDDGSIVITAVMTSVPVNTDPIKDSARGSLGVPVTRLVCIPYRPHLVDLIRHGLSATLHDVPVDQLLVAVEFTGERDLVIRVSHVGHRTSALLQRIHGNTQDFLRPVESVLPYDRVRVALLNAQ